MMQRNSSGTVDVGSNASVYTTSQIDATRRKNVASRSENAIGHVGEDVSSVGNTSVGECDEYGAFLAEEEGEEEYEKDSQVLEGGFEEEFDEKVGESYNDDDLLARFNGLKSLIGKAEAPTVVDRDGLTGTELASKAMAKRAQATARAFKSCAQDLEIKLIYCNSERIRLADRIEVLEGQRFMLAICCCLTMPTLVAALLSHHFNLHEWEITWLVLGCWLIVMYVLLFIVARICSSIRKSRERRDNAMRHIQKPSKEPGVPVPSVDSTRDSSAVRQRRTAFQEITV
uniref:Transmembrane protein n=1 Tax=Mucochytrium quahogii TaxID=96639 RepID=A0A7S2WAL6_9STRA|mmetsp:Transcript_10933/g.17914  ORF Transcript_10933/g.17914 Transcript_10933/m.17914 type:complete len:286 (+) Transcript_10933:128-985(+)